MTGVRVAGVGLTHFGVHLERAGRDLFAGAGLASLDDAGIGPADVDFAEVLALETLGFYDLADAVGTTVQPTVEETETAGERALVLRPA